MAASPRLAAYCGRMSRRDDVWMGPLPAAFLALAALAGMVVIGFTAGARPVRIDRNAASAVELWRNDYTLSAAVFLDWIGVSTPAVVVSIVITVALLLWRRPWAALSFALAALIGAGAIDLFKAWFSRPRPLDGLVDVGVNSYPSGHSAHAAIVAMMLCLIFPRVWVWVLGVAVTVAMMLSRMLLGVHWLTDVVGGALLGVAIALAAWAIAQSVLRTEADRPHPLIWRGRRPVTPEE